MILVGRLLGPADFGALGLVQSTLGVAALLAGIGFGNASTRFVAHYADIDPERAGRIAGLLSLSSLTAISLVTVALLVGAHGLAKLILGDADLNGPLMLGALLVATWSLRGVQNGLWTAVDGFRTLAILNLLDGLLSLLATIALVSFFGLGGAIAGLALGSGLAWVLGEIAIRRALRQRGVRLQYRGAWQERKLLVAYALPSTMSGLVTTPVLWVVMAYVSRVEGQAALGLYNAAYQWHGPAFFIPTMLTVVSMPRLVKAWSANDSTTFRAISAWLYFAVLLLTVPLALAGSLASRHIMALYGEAFAAAAPMLVLLLAAAPFHALWRVSATLLYGMDKPWMVLASNLLWAVVLGLFTALAIGEWGTTALAAGFLAAYVASSAGCLIGVGVSAKRMRSKA